MLLGIKQDEVKEQKSWKRGDSPVIFTSQLTPKIHPKASFASAPRDVIAAKGYLDRPPTYPGRSYASCPNNTEPGPAPLPDRRKPNPPDGPGLAIVVPAFRLRDSGRDGRCGLRGGCRSATTVNAWEKLRRCSCELSKTIALTMQRA